jgi:hypothetical protein
MQHRLGIVHDRAATTAHGAAMCASVAATSDRYDSPGVSVDLHSRLFTGEKQP